MTFYSTNHQKFIQQYDSLDPNEVHARWLSILPQVNSSILDVGAGSGRDARWLAAKGHEVVAIEPATQLRNVAMGHADNKGILWVDDSLPSISKTTELDRTFDLILVSAVWMHIPVSDRERAFRKLANLLNPGGKLIITLRHGNFTDGRTAYHVNAIELKQLATKHVLQLIIENKSTDKMGREDVSWETLVFQLPDDGTSALPLLRHIIINDVKTSTYKLALLRILLRIADGSPGAIIHRDDEKVVLPFGLVALYWLRAYKPLLLDANILQMPKGSGRPGFAKKNFQQLHNISAFDLKVGYKFSGDMAQTIYQCMKDVRTLIKQMPAHYITYPGSDRQVFICKSLKVPMSNSDFTLDQSFLSQFGTFTIPRVLWDAMSQFACWIEPAIISQWCQLMQGYERRSGTMRPLDEYLQHLTWLDPVRNTNFVRKIVDAKKSAGKNIHCVWTGKKLKNSYAIDHCFPFAFWPNNDLWNLMPSASQANQRKSSKLPSAQLLNQAQERICEWWHDAYYTDPLLTDCFLQEAKIALPMGHPISSPDIDIKYIFQGMHNQRSRLKTFQQIMEWDGVNK